MSLVKCRECGTEVSTTAKACPKCGAAPPKKTSVATWVMGGIFALALWNFMTGGYFSSSPSNAAVPDSRPSIPLPDPKQERIANYQAAFALDQKAGRQWLLDRLREFCEAQDKHLNYIKVTIRGDAMYCVHDFYTKYALSSGKRGPALGEWVSEHFALLEKNKVTRVGVWGTGEHSSGAWFNVKR
jgi:hypothetical protein